MGLVLKCERDSRQFNDVSLVQKPFTIWQMKCPKLGRKQEPIFWATMLHDFLQLGPSMGNISVQDNRANDEANDEANEVMDAKDLDA